MAEPCPSPNSDNISSSVSADESKTECASPSPTETVCLDSLCAAGPSQGPKLIADTPTCVKPQDKDVFLNKLGLDKVDECLDSSNDDRFSHDCDDDNWEDCEEVLEDDQEALQVANVQVSLELVFS